MKAMLKIFGLIVITTFILSLKVKDQTLFSHVYKFISPGTEKAQKVTQDLFDSSLSTTRKYTKKIFDNSVPKMKDSIRSKLAGQKKNFDTPEEDIKPDEKKELDDLIKSH